MADLTSRKSETEFKVTHVTQWTQKAWSKGRTQKYEKQFVLTQNTGWYEPYAIYV